MRDLKIGGKIRVRKDLVEGKRYGDDAFVIGMQVMLGKIVTIKQIISPDKYRIEEYGMNWTTEMFEPIKITNWRSEFQE